MNSNVPCLASPVNRLKEEIFGLRSVVHFFFLCPAMFVVHQLGISDRSIPCLVRKIHKETADAVFQIFFSPGGGSSVCLLVGFP
jgi:hypothetical protein